MVIKDIKKDIKQYNRMSQEYSISLFRNVLRHLDSFAINFQQ